MKELLSFRGTASRFEWWMTSLVADLLIQVGLIFAMLSFSGDTALEIVVGIGLVALTLVCLWVSLAVSIRRLRDRERPWQIVFLALIPYVGWMGLVVECGMLRSPSQTVKKKVVRRMINVGEESAEKS